MKYIAYYRVSTKKQGASGLGLEAQKSTILNYIKPNDDVIYEEYTEIESGKVNNRPQLTKALDMCRLTGATLIVAKLDRLSRDQLFLSQFIAGDIPFVIADFPQANAFTLQIFAAQAEYERKLISERTKAALARSEKPKGIKGSENLKNRKEGQENSLLARQDKSSKYSEIIKPIINEYVKKGLSLSGIAAALNSRDIKTIRGKEWDATRIKRILLTNKVFNDKVAL